MLDLQLPVESVPIITKGYATNETDHHDITEKLLKVALNIINQPTLNTEILKYLP
jgi:hypothetical protein